MLTGDPQVYPTLGIEAYAKRQHRCRNWREPTRRWSRRRCPLAPPVLEKVRSANFARTDFSELRSACPHCCKMENGDSSTGNDEPGTPQGAIHPYETYCKREVVL